MSDWEGPPVAETLLDFVGGVWGEEPGIDEVDVSVVRSTEFRPTGYPSLESAARRSVTRRQLVRRELRAGDILLEKSGGGPKQPVGRVVFIEAPGLGLICSNFVLLMRPDPEKVVPRYLFYWLWLSHVTGVTLRFQSATTGIRNLKTPDYLAEAIPLPALDEQERIVEVLSGIDAAVMAHEICVARAERALAALREDLIELQDYERAPLATALQRIEGGKSPLAEERQPVAGERAVLKVSAVRPGFFNPTGVKVLDPSMEMPDRAILRDDDLLVTRANTAALVGAVCLVKQAPADYFLSDKTLRLVPDEQRLDKRFAVHALATQRVRREMAEVATGTSASMKNVSQEKFRALSIALPPLPEQSRIADVLDGALETVRSLVEHADALHAVRRSTISALLTGHHELPRDEAVFALHD